MVVVSLVLASSGPCAAVVAVAAVVQDRGTVDCIAETASCFFGAEASLVCELINLILACVSNIQCLSYASPQSCHGH